MDSHRVLLVEDNPGDVRLIREELRDARRGRFELVHADRLSQGLTLLDAGGFDAVLLDLSLPDSRGLDSLAAVQARAPRVPVVVLTGFTDEEIAVKAMRAGAQDYLVKGRVDGDGLARAIHYAIERARATGEMDELKRQLALSERLATMGALLAGVAREIRATTTRVTGELYDLRRSIEQAARHDPALMDLVEEASECSLAAVEGTKWIERMVGDLLRSMTAGPATRVRVALQDAVVPALEAFALNNEGRVRIAALLDPTPEVALDPGQLQQMLLHLLHNAAEAMPDGGTIRVTTRMHDGAPELEVSDDGPGLVPEVEQHLFEPFKTTKEGSAGLGLAVVKRVMDAHHGSIRYARGPSGGAVFTAIFPPAAVDGPSGERMTA